MKLSICWINKVKKKIYKKVEYTTTLALSISNRSNLIKLLNIFNDLWKSSVNTCQKTTLKLRLHSATLRFCSGIKANCKSQLRIMAKRCTLIRLFMAIIILKLLETSITSHFAYSILNSIACGSITTAKV